MQISEIREYDKKRKEIVLDDGKTRFLLYRAELRACGLLAGGALSGEDYRKILDEILKPRARKRALYYLKDGDKTRAQIAAKLRQSRYPEEAVEDALSFLSQYRFVDDRRFAENYVEELKGKRSKREILMKLQSRGISGGEAKVVMGELLCEEDEYRACERALREKLWGRRQKADTALDPDAKRRAYGFLLRKGFSYDAVEHSFRRLAEGLSDCAEEE